MDYDDYEQAKYEEWLDTIVSRFRDEHREEIAGELYIEEILEPILSAHAATWSQTEAVLLKARSRLGESENEEAVFHASRAIDGYIATVLVDPIRRVTANRIGRSLPPNFPIKENDVLKNARGLEGAFPFVAYAISVVAGTAPNAAAAIGALKKLITRSTNDPSWSLRNQVLHSPATVDQATANGFVNAVADLLSLIQAEIGEQVRARADQRKKTEFVPERVEVLTFLAQLYALDRAAAVPDYKISVDSIAARERRDLGLSSLVADGYVERFEPDRFDRRYRLTQEGMTYFNQHVLQKIDKRKLTLASYNADAFLQAERDLLARRRATSAP